MTAKHLFDPLDQDTIDAPGPAYAQLAAQCPFHRVRTKQHDFWVTSDYDEIKNKILAGAPEWSFRFGNAAKDSISDVGFKTDPPFHMLFRMAIQRGFAAPALKRYEAIAENITRELIDAMEASSARAGDFCALFALPLPARMMCIMLGAPEADYLNYKRWSDTLQYLIFHDPEPGSYETVLNEIYPHFTQLIETRREKLKAAGIDAPDESHLGDVIPDDFMSRALVGTVEGRPLSHDEALNICLAFLTGGQETTTNLIGNCLWRLLKDRALWARLIAEPELIDIAVEESLRLDPPVLAHFRTSLCPVSMHGQNLPEHAKLMFNIAGANRSPEIFDEPDDFNLDRPLNEARKHLSFGSGIHLCMGAPVARIEARIALKHLTTRLPDLRLEGDGERVGTWMYWGRASLPVAW